MIVKEISPSGKTRRVYYSFENHVRLLPAAEERFENMICNGDSVTPFGFWSSSPITINFTCRHSNETVQIFFAVSKEGGGMLGMASSLKMGIVDGARYADRLRMELESGGFVTAVVYTTGREGYRWTEREIDIRFTVSSLISTLRSLQFQFIEIPSHLF